jgi:hypothetical protein
MWRNSMSLRYAVRFFYNGLFPLPYCCWSACSPAPAAAGDRDLFYGKMKTPVDPEPARDGSHGRDPA